VDPVEPEIVRIIVGGARIKRVTRQQVEYLNEAGQDCSVNLEECCRNYVQSSDENRGDCDLLTSEDTADISSQRYVADRGMLEDSPWIAFTNKRRTRFEFGSSDEAQHLRSQLAMVRWRTFDAN
jgi:hypothetical protein